MQTSDFVDDFELFNKMKEKCSNKNKNENEKNEKKENAVKKIEKNGFDYYRILGVDKDMSISDIQKKSRKLLAKFHPDKYKDLPEKEKKAKEIQFQLVQFASKVLTDEDSKKVYDLEQKTIKNQDFLHQKNTFDDFIKMQENNMTEENKQKARIEFDVEISKLNKARGFEPDKLKEKLSKSDFDKEAEDLIARRDTELIELSQRNLFEGRSFNRSEFNKIFEKDKKKHEKKLKKKQESGEIAKIDDHFTAFNDNGLDNFISIDADYSDPFGEGGNIKENTLFGKITKQFSVSDISSDDDDYNDDYKSHNQNRDITSAEDAYSKMMREREMFDNNLKDTKTAGYKDVMEDQFGISRQFGKMLGRDITQKTKPQKIDSDMVNIYNKMIGYDSDTSDDE